MGVSTRKWWSTRPACVAALSKEANQTNVLARTRSERQIHRWFFAAYRNNERPVGRRRSSSGGALRYVSSSEFACAQRSERDNRSTLAASASAFSKEANQTTTSSPPPPKEAQSPAMRQYLQFKAQYPNYVLFFRMGDFYEMFWDDAKVAAKTLGVALTSRSRGGIDAEDAIPMAGVPFHAVESYLRRMIAAGHKVAKTVYLDTKDGVKFFVDDGSWLLVRLSGTEPLIRVYAETRSKDEIKPMLDAGERMVEGA